MEVYADGLGKALESNGIEPFMYIPTSKLERFDQNSWVMRYLRYQYYPSHLRKYIINDTQIHHVIDHGYAHLFTGLGNGKKIISVHDLIPFLTWRGVIRKMDGSYFSKRKPRLNLHSLEFIQHYDHIVSVSQSTANDLTNYFGIAKESISVIPPVIDKQYLPASTDAIKQLRSKYQLDQDTKWLMISGREYYKNHHTSLLVLKNLLENSEQPVKLIKTGMPSIEFDALVDDLGLATSVKSVFLKDKSDMPALYSMVDCLLFPSLYEGFGMPVAEALACGTPVVMSDRGSLPEVGGKLALQCDAFNVPELSKAVNSQLNIDVKRHICEFGPAWVSKFREVEVGKQMVGLYQSLV